MRRCILIACLLSSPMVAQAANEEARAHYQKGMTEYNLGHFSEAIKEFESAFRLEQDPSLLFNMAQAYRQDGNHAKALFFYKRFRSVAPDSPLKDKVDVRIRELERLVREQEDEKKKPPTNVEPQQSAVPTGTTPSPSTATPTTGTPESTPVEAAVPATQPEPQPSQPTADTAQAKHDTTPQNTAAATEAPRHRGARIGGYVLTGVGVAAIAAGVAFGLKARSDSDKVTQATRFDPSVEESGQRAQTLQWVFLGAGAAAIAGGAVLLLLSRASAESSSHVAFAPSLTGSSLGAMCRIEF